MNPRTQRRPIITLAVAISAILAACSNSGTSTAPSVGSIAASASVAPSAAAIDLSQVPPKPDFAGAVTADGATFPQPVYEQWTSDYANETGVQISYTGGGSGQGIKDITANIVQFAGSDAPMKPDEQSAAETANGPILHIPTVFGAIVMAYNVGGISKPLNFSPEVIGKIFTGQITKWNDPAIAADNAGVTLPALAITVSHRNDGSGTTNAFTSWLCKVSTDWKAAVNPCSGKEVTWPVGLGGKGNAGVAGNITSTPGAIGYVELAFAVQNSLPFGNVKNKAGTFITPSLDSVAAAAKFDTIPDSLTFDAWDTTVADGYPIVTATWILVYQQQDKVNPDEKQAQAVVHFLIWALDKGGDAAKALDYAVLPDALRQAALAKIATITYNGTPIVDALYK
ncbi:MAG: phosphate ABC transporter substrate-binding protein PstS [Chloroflexota bacterium]|nr:phosphate ABC transporter substrate-binding protein PstS [Chloroflexota bacterium]